MQTVSLVLENRIRRKVKPTESRSISLSAGMVHRLYNLNEAAFSAR
jgi:hypothetical protein